MCVRVMRQKNVFFFFITFMSCAAIDSRTLLLLLNFFLFIPPPFLLLLLSGQYIRNGDAIAVISYERIEEEEEEKLPITISLFPPSSCRERDEEKETKEMRETNNKEVGIYNITNTTTTDYIGGLLALSTKSRWTHDTIHV
jgi:hypothetical protein